MKYIAELEKLGVEKNFTPGASTEEIVGWVRENVVNRRSVYVAESRQSQSEGVVVYCCS